LLREYGCCASASYDSEKDALLSPSSSFAIAGYLPDYRFYINVNETAPYLTDLMLFSVSPPATFSASTKLTQSCCLDEGKFEVAREARAYKLRQNPQGPKLKLWVTVGGGGRSNGFASLWKNEKQLGLFIQALIRLASEEKLDGVDLDCEQITSQDDFRQYIELMHRVAPALHAKGLLLSVALHARMVLPSSTYASVDRINLMAYDMQGKYHAELKDAENACEQLIASGCPPNKIVLGIPAYGRHHHRPSEVKTFSEGIDAFESSSKTSVLAEKVDRLDVFQSFQYESPRAVRAKAAYAKKKGLGGVFLWELGQDKQHAIAPGGILLEAASGRHYENGHRESTNSDDEL